MANRLHFAAVLLSAASWSARAACKSPIEKPLDWIFYERAAINRGQLDGMTIGWNKEELVAHLASKGVAKIHVVSDRYFFATHECVQNLEQIAVDDLLYVAGTNMKVEGKIYIQDDVVARVEGLQRIESTIASGMRRSELVVVLEQLLNQNRKISI
jgi:hypothetical protein